MYAIITTGDFRATTDTTDTRPRDQGQVRASVPVVLIPPEFREEVERAVESRSLGKLALLNDEVGGASWDADGRQLVAWAQGWVRTARSGAPGIDRIMLFTGHQVDAPGRGEPRFPPDREPIARTAIHDAIEHVVAGECRVLGVAGAASGGDILFHEVCAEVGISTRLYLALPPDVYVAESVAPAGPEWVQRFWVVHARHRSAPVLAQTKDPPTWLRHRPDYSIWRRNNLWTLHETLAAGARHVTVLALWNGKTGDGPGGTADMLDIARQHGAETRVLDTRSLFGLPM